MTTIEQIQSGNHDFEASDLLDELASVFPVIDRLADTPQDAEWHAEGNVRIHTEWVIREAQEIVKQGELSPRQSEALLLGAALHDVGKVFTTREEKRDGRIRITSPRHAGTGRNHIAPALAGMDLAPEVFHKVLGLVGHHHDPLKLISRNARAPRFARCARAVEAVLLHAIEQADIRGRSCQDKEDKLALVDLFRDGAKHSGTWAQNLYADWEQRLRAEIGDDDQAYRFALGEAILDFENGKIRSPEEALQRTYSYRRDYGTVTVMCGPSGAGKSSWIRENAAGAACVSLDEIRRELSGKRSDQSKNGQVIQLAKERLREALRKKQDIIWDATNLRVDGRSMVVDLARNYHAYTRIIVLPVTESVAEKRNRKRTHSIPAKVLTRQFERWEWPEPWEAHEVVIAKN